MGYSHSHLLQGVDGLLITDLLELGGTGRRVKLSFFLLKLEVRQHGEFLKSIQTGTICFGQTDSFRRSSLKEGLCFRQGRIMSGQVQGVQDSARRVRV